jgi:hypothetical protein
VEIWASSASATEGFTKLADTSVALEPSAFKQATATLNFAPIDARYVKVRFATHHQNGRRFRIVQIKVMEASAAGYVPLLKRHPEILEPAFIAEGNTAAWTAQTAPANELGDSNAVTEWQPGWCGHMVVRNANGVFGFVQAYAHYGKGLILWDGFDIDMNGTKWHDIVRAQQLAQGFNTDNLPCTIKIGSFAVTTEPRLATRGVQAGQTYTYPLALLSNLGYKGTVSLSAAPTPAMPGLQAKFEPATVEVTSLQESTLTLALPAGAPVKPFAVEVKGTAADEGGRAGRRQHAGAADVKASGLDIRLNIVGFALKNPQTQKDLSGFAQSTGGLFYAADSGAGLADAVMLAAVERFPYTVYDLAGKAVLASEAGSGSDELPPGEYKVVVKAGTRELVAPRVKVAAGGATTLKIAIKNGQVVLE